MVLYAAYLLVGQLFFPRIAMAQDIENEVLDLLSLPALEIFVEKQLSRSIYYWDIALVGVGLAVAVLVVLYLLLVRKLTFKLLLRIMTIWMVFGAGLSAVVMSVYVSQNKQNAVLRADSESLPRNIKIQTEDGELYVLWRTQKQTIGQLIYTSNLRQDPTILLSNDAEPATSHFVSVKIRPGENEYWLSVISDGQEYRLDGEPVHLVL